MKSKIFLCLIFLFKIYNGFSYSDSTVTAEEFKYLIGCWKGTITYLDYSSNKPFTMPANMTVKDFTNKNSIVYSINYPTEPSANSIDTIFISENGRFINNEPIKKKLKLTDSLEVITEIAGIDGNDNKAALIRHTYRISKNTFSVQKEVQFVGQKSWILRNEYKYTLTKPCS